MSHSTGYVGAHLSARKRRELFAKPWYQMSEDERLALLTPDTQEVASKILTSLKAEGYDARLGETWRSVEGQKEQYEAGRSRAEKPGWHNFGRAFHIIIVHPDTGKVWEEAYPVAGKLAKNLDVIWLGDRVMLNKYGSALRDLAHFEYHPAITIAMARHRAGIA